MKRHGYLLLPLLLLCVATSAFAQALVDPFPLVLPTWDSTASDWLPQPSGAVAGSHGFVRASENGHLEFSDGTAARFNGVNIIGSGCFPDSIGAIATARRLRKFGVNLVRFNYFDYHNNTGASTIAAQNNQTRKFDSLSPTQMARLDWFLYQLKLNGIYAHFVLKSRQGPRTNDGVYGADSAYASGAYLTFFDPAFQRLQREYIAKFLGHINPHTTLSYATDPSIALITVSDLTSIFDQWLNDRLNQRNNTMSYHHSRQLDTLFNRYLLAKYGSTNAIKNAWFEGSKTDGKNTMSNGGFESFTDNWVLTVGEGAQGSAVIVQGNDVAPGEGTSSMRIVVRQINGNDGRLYLEQVGLPIHRGKIFRLSFKAKTDTAAGRRIRVSIQAAGTALNQNVDITNQWATYTYTFRANGTDTVSSYIRFYAGGFRGDVFLDAISLVETGREGLAAGEDLSKFTVARTRYAALGSAALLRAMDVTAFYDSLARTYFSSMRDYVRSLGVKAPITGTNNTAGSADTWTQTGMDFTSESAQWDYNGARPGFNYSDSTWVIRNYSILNYRDQRVNEFSRNAIVGKPFIVEGYGQIFPNRHRPEMMIFLPAYAALHGWDGINYYLYNDRSSEATDRRRFIKDDFSSMIADPSVMALMPQAMQMFRSGWVVPSLRTLRIQHDVADLRTWPLTYSARGVYQIDGTFNNVSNLVSSVRVDSFNASRHYTAGDYYFTVPNDDNIQSDTRQITLDMTKGVISINTPMIQGGSGQLANVSALRTDQLGINFLEGGKHVTYLWSSLTEDTLGAAQRSLLTVTTRAANTNALWTYGDSSFAKNWGTTPTMMEGARIGVNFYTAADTIILYPLDSLGQPTGKALPAAKTPQGVWRVIVDLAQEKTPWFGVEQRFSSDPTTGVDESGSNASGAIGEVVPNPATNEALLPIAIPAGGAPLRATLFDAVGRAVRQVANLQAAEGNAQLPIDLSGIPAGSYTLVVVVGGQHAARRVVVQ